MVTFPISKRKRINHKSGYVLVYVPEHFKSFADGWYYEHRVILEQFLMRPLEDWETVHHINGNKKDNSINNLFVCTSKQHSKAHRVAK